MTGVQTCALPISFETEIARRAEIVGAWGLGGGFDYLLQVVTPDIDAYQRLIDALLGADVGLSRYYTYIVTSAVKSAPPPVDLLAARRTD